MILCVEYEDGGGTAFPLGFQDMRRGYSIFNDGVITIKNNVIYLIFCCSKCEYGIVKTELQILTKEAKFAKCGNCNNLIKAVIKKEE